MSVLDCWLGCLDGWSAGPRFRPGWWEDHHLLWGRRDPDPSGQCRTPPPVERSQPGLVATAPPVSQPFRAPVFRARLCCVPSPVRPAAPRSRRRRRCPDVQGCAWRGPASWTSWAGLWLSGRSSTWRSSIRTKRFRVTSSPNLATTTCPLLASGVRAMATMSPSCRPVRDMLSPARSACSRAAAGTGGRWRRAPAPRCGPRRRSRARGGQGSLRACPGHAEGEDRAARSTVRGRMTSWYLPRLKVSRTRSATPDEAIWLWFMCRPFPGAAWPVTLG